MKLEGNKRLKSYAMDNLRDANFLAQVFLIGMSLCMGKPGHRCGD